MREVSHVCQVHEGSHRVTGVVTVGVLGSWTLPSPRTLFFLLLFFSLFSFPLSPNGGHVEWFMGLHRMRKSV